MPKIRERDPNDKIKTKGKKRSGQRKKKSNISPQVQATIREKANQHREKETPNEYAVNTTEEAASEIAAGAWKISSNAAGAAYTKGKSFRKNIKTMQEESNVDLSDVSIEPHTDYSYKSTPYGPKDNSGKRIVETNAGNGDIFSVERGRNLIVQTYAEKRANGVEATHNNQPHIKPELDYSHQVIPKTKEVFDHTSPENCTTRLIISGTKVAPVEQGRKLAIESHIARQADKSRSAIDYQSIVELGHDYDLHTNHRETERFVGTVPLEKQAARHQRLQGLTEQKQNVSTALDSGIQASSGAESSAEITYRGRERPKDKLAPKQKPKIEPKTRSRLEHASPKIIRPEKANHSARALTNAQKAVEMGRRKFMQEAQRQMQRQAQKAVRATSNFARKAALAIVKVIQSIFSTLVAAFGCVGAVAILAVILLIGAVLASPFGILFANEPSPDAIPLSAAVSQISAEFSARLEELQQGEYDKITVTGNPPDWKEVIAVFACHVAGGEHGVDVMLLDEEKVDRLRTAFWDMCVLTAEEETEEWTGPTTPMDASIEPVKTLTITIEAKSAEDMRAFYSFSKLQNDALTELLAEKEMLNNLIGSLEVSEEEAIDLLNRMPSDVSAQRKAVVQQALTLVGKVNYFWGGKSLLIGWDSRWGQPMEVWAAGSPTTGTIRPYGLDCSGFTDWVFYNVSGGSYILGHGGCVATQHTYCASISWDQVQPGDLAFYPDDSHVGIVGGWDDAGNLLIIHCASGQNNVVITGRSGFASVGRPYYFGE